MTDNFDVEAVSNRIKKIVEDLRLRFYDINYNQISRILRIYIDKQDGAVTVKDCKEVSSMIAKELDSSETFNVSYTLEVSSPGVDRQLKRPEHYSWVLGKLVEIDVGDKKIRAYLRNARNDGIVIGTQAGENFIPYASIVKAKVVEEILYGKRR